MLALLTDYEKQLVTDPEILRSKNRIIQLVTDLFAEVFGQYQKALQHKTSSGFFETNPKISRGENYLGLPYVMLDYPRHFAKEDIFAVRSFFWWGNFFSITLHLSGKYLQQFSLLVEKAIAEKKFEGWYVSMSNDQWQHHFEKENYLMINENENYAISSRLFLKLATKISLTQWEESEVFFVRNFNLLLEVMKDYAPIR